MTLTTSHGRAQRSGLEALGWTSFTALTLGILIPVLIIDWTSPDGSLKNILIAWFITILSAMRIALCIAKPRVAILELGVYLFFYVFVGITALAQTVSGMFPLDDRTYSAGTQTRQLLVLLSGVIAFEVGRLLVSRVGREKRVQDPVQFAQVGTVVLALIGLAATAQQVTSNGLLVFFVSRTETARILSGQTGSEPIYTAVDKTGIALQTGLAQFPVFIALFAILYARHHRLWKPARSDLPWRTLIFFLILANVVVNNPIGNSRLFGLLVIFAFISIYFDVASPAGARTFIFFSLAILLLAFPILDAFRITDSDRVLAFNPQESLVLNGSYPVYQMALNGDQYVAVYGKTDGKQIASAVFAFIPRSIWESKGEPTGQVVDPNFLRSASLWTEAYVDFGILGVIAVMMTLGVAARRLSRRWGIAGPGVFHAIVPLLTIYAFFILRGSLLPAVATLYQLSACFALASMFGPSASVRRSRRSSKAVG